MTTALPERVAARFDPIQPQRAHEYVAEQIRRHIALRLIRPGEMLPPERELAAMFGVGRPTIQLALRELEADVLVEARRGRHGGTVVLGPEDDAAVLDELVARVVRRRGEIEELLVYRRTLEPPTARLAAEERDDDDLAAMREVSAAMGAAETEPEYMHHDTAFHLAVAGATHNAYLAREIEEIRLGLNDAISLLPETDTWHRRISGEHDAILAAIEARDGAAAHARMEVHVDHSDQSLRALLAAVGRRQRS